MKLKDYLKERFSCLLINFIGFFSLVCILLLLDIKGNVIFSILILWFFPLMSYILIEYMKAKKHYNHMEGLLESLDEKYLLSEIMQKPTCLEEKLFYEILRICNKSMHEHVNEYKNLQLEYREYIETWVHEIKTPIASSMLIIENNKSEGMDNIGQEIKKIDGFVEQALYYARSSHVSQDYLIKKFDLVKVINHTIRRNAKDFIHKKIDLQLDEINEEVYSDIKWVQFILHQIISNAIKYMKEQDGKIKIYAKKNKNNVILIIEDNGIGISEKDLHKVFEKGYTGEHGRKYTASTGMGLYLCKKLCQKLGLAISITSQLGVGTKVNITFPLSKFHLES
ncbi:sensor histidine kinase [Crassaminicella profunda]|uniref:sensor histidine kinase n=1 Tax=Crassaminicella profunda TaxID=1286698 RepID=UPI001CA60CAE|nr:sensor histidine kinase [Crassaminicella profunda]QZY55167.1 sensor histidine kinase [Crassaminicella profunda]